MQNLSQVKIRQFTSKEIIGIHGKGSLSAELFYFWSSHHISIVSHHISIGLISLTIASLSIGRSLVIPELAYHNPGFNEGVMPPLIELPKFLFLYSSEHRFTPYSALFCQPAMITKYAIHVPQLLNVQQNVQQRIRMSAVHFVRHTKSTFSNHS